MVHEYVLVNKQDVVMAKKNPGTPEQYIERHHLTTYFEDAVSQLLEYRLENSRVDAADFFHNYFKSVVQNEHTLHREYNFIQATPRNRAAFIRTFWGAFQNVGRENGLLSVAEYHSLTLLVCPDFPVDVLQNTARVLLMEDAIDCLISFPEFIYAFQFQVYYEEFVSALSQLYTRLHSGKQSWNDTTKTTNPTDDTLLLQPISCTALLDAIKETIYNDSKSTKWSCPPLECLENILSTNDNVTYFGLLVTLTRSEMINCAVGVLSPRDQLLVHASEN